MRITPRIDFNPITLTFDVDKIPFMSAEAISAIKDALDAGKVLYFKKDEGGDHYRSYSEEELLTLLQTKLNDKNPAL